MDKKIIIIGAGPIGLVTGWLLSEKKWNVQIYEMNSIVGGMCRSWKWNNFILDTDDKVSYKQLGNSVNVDNVRNIIESTLKLYGLV